MARHLRRAALDDAILTEICPRRLCYVAALVPVPMVCSVATEHAALDHEFLKPPRLDIEG
jgi:hypothetical protein